MLTTNKTTVNEMNPQRPNATVYGVDQDTMNTLSTFSAGSRHFVHESR